MMNEKGYCSWCRDMNTNKEDLTLCPCWDDRCENRLCKKCFKNAQQNISKKNLSSNDATMGLDVSAYVVFWYTSKQLKLSEEDIENLEAFEDKRWSLILMRHYNSSKPHAYVVWLLLGKADGENWGVRKELKIQWTQDDYTRKLDAALWDLWIIAPISSEVWYTMPSSHLVLRLDY